MKGSPGNAALALLAASALSACHTMRFEVGDGRVGDVVRHRKAFYLGGLVPTNHVDVGEFCPMGAVAVEEETTLADGLFTHLTLWIYTPRTSIYSCAAEGLR